MLGLISLVVSACILSTSVDALKCFHCDLAKNITCPGWDRAPIDSALNLGDLVGLYDQCVTVRLADGRIVAQNIYPGETHCKPIFLQSWQLLLNNQWNQEVQISCCNEDGCNGRPKPRSSKARSSGNLNQQHFLLQPLLLLLLLSSSQKLMWQMSQS